MAKDIKLSLDNATLLAVLQVAFDTAIEQKTAALEHHDTVREGLRFTNGDGRADLSTLMANKEIAETIEKYLKSADASIDKMIKIARLLADVMLRSNEDEYGELDEDEKEELRKAAAEFAQAAQEAKEDD